MLNIPPAMNLPDNLVAVPSIMFRDPVEGKQSTTQVIDWSIPIGKNLTTISVNLQNNATMNFSQICGLIIDNSACGSDITFMFPDTDVTITIPAYAPFTVLDVSTQQTQFFVVAHSPIVGDLTRYSILNFAPPPVAVPVSIQQLVVSVMSIPLNGVATTPIVLPGVNGSLRTLNVTAGWNAAPGPFNDALVLEDGTGAVLWAANVLGDATPPGGTILLADLTGLSTRFSNGVSLIQTGGFATGGTVDVNFYYRIP